MTDEMEARLRERLRDAPLPAAPESLRAYLASLPRDAQPTQAKRRSLGLILLLAAVLALSIGAVLMSGSAPTIRLKADIQTFRAPGIAFEYPTAWTDQTAAVGLVAQPGIRFVAVLARGLVVCPKLADAAAPTPKPGSCESTPTSPGSLMVFVAEYLHQLPGAFHGGTKTDVGAYPVREQPASGGQSGSPSQLWTIDAPDGGVYFVSMTAPSTDIDARRADVLRLLASVQLTAWEAAPSVVDGRIHLDLPEGFSLDYPAGWTVYYPQDMSTMDSAVVTVASAPLLAPCASDSCERFTTPPGTIAIEFRVGGGLTSPDWSKATTTVGGQPAFRQDWGPQNATGADEGRSWSVRLNARSSLGIYVSLRGPGLPALRAAMDRVLSSVRITASPSTAP